MQFLISGEGHSTGSWNKNGTSRDENFHKIDACKGAKNERWECDTHGVAEDEEEVKEEQERAAREVGGIPELLDVVERERESKGVVLGREPTMRRVNQAC